MSSENEKPVVVMDRYSGTDQTYKVVVRWKVGHVWELEHGHLHRVYLASDTYAKTHFKLTVMGKIMFKDVLIPAAMDLVFPSNVIPREKEIVLECKSTDGTAIVVDVAVTGSEY